MMRWISVIIFVLLAGCSAGLKNRWVDFNAYYNTYYNAKVSFERGLTLVENQTVTFNPERPIRIHMTPARAGLSDFEKAIDKGANILRRYPESKWADDALVLIGKSFFYLGQYYSADQKFQETLGASPNELIRQEAVLWRGRFFLEAERYQDGIIYLNSRIVSEEFNWDPQILAEMELVLAQLHVALTQYAQADEMFAKALPVIRDRDLKGRGYFLYAQVLERLGNHKGAYDQYASVSSNYRHYQLIYLANLKKGEISRRLGDYDLAYRTFHTMSRDDKNFEQSADLNYEIARTLHLSGKNAEAQAIYKNVLYSSLRPPSRPTVVKTHFALGELNRDYHLNYRIAAAYFDTSARQANDPLLLPENFNASDLARSFGDYARLKTEINRLDSLMWLGSLPKGEFDSVLTRIRADRMRELESRLREEQSRGATLVNVTPGSQANQGSVQESGFLNHKNPALVTQASESFSAIWQARPLVDNWRRAEAVRQATVTTENTAVQRNGSTQQQQQLQAMLRIDLTEIPFTAQSREITGNKIANLRYEMGNVLFLSLDMADSARVYYQSVVNKYPRSDSSPQALYSLTEVELAKSDTIAATQTAKRLITNYPETLYAFRMNQRFQMSSDIKPPAARVSTEDSLKIVYENLVRSTETVLPADKANSFYDFGLSHINHPVAANALLTSALTWAALGRTSSFYLESIQKRTQIQHQFNLKQEELARKKEEVIQKNELNDLTAEEIKFRDSIADSTIPAPNLNRYFPYTGAEWDSVRSVLKILVDKHPASESTKRARIMMNELAVPEVDDEVESVDVVETSQAEEIIFDCNDLDASLEIRNGMEVFIESSGIKEIMEAQNVFSADFEFEITVDQTGKPILVTPISEEDDFDFIQFLTNQMRYKMEFNPPSVNNRAVMVRCDLIISVRL